VKAYSFIARSIAKSTGMLTYTGMI